MIALISCTATKRKAAGFFSVRELYSPSALFRKSLAYAERRKLDGVYVLSAMHGLLTLDMRVAPYELELTRMTRQHRARWARRVVDAISMRHTRRVPWLVLAGASYAAPLLEEHETLGVGRGAFIEPLARLQIGERLRFLDEDVSVSHPSSTTSP